MLLVFTSFIINTNIFSLLIYFFHLIKGYTAIFNYLPFYAWKEKKIIYIYIYTRQIS